MDGSPYFAEAFAMILQVVDSHTWKSFNHWWMYPCTIIHSMVKLWQAMS
jgi:hypothetical protein